MGLTLEQKEKYFNLSYAGFFLDDLAVRDSEGSLILLFRCHECHALTNLPVQHIQFHERLARDIVNAATF